MNTHFILVNTKEELNNMSKQELINEITKLRQKNDILTTMLNQTKIDYNNKIDSILNNTNNIIDFLKNNRKIYTNALDAVKEQENKHQKELNKILNPIDFSLRMNNGYWRMHKPNGSRRKRSDSFSQQLIDDMINCNKNTHSDEDTMSTVSEKSFETTKSH